MLSFFVIRLSGLLVCILWSCFLFCFFVLFEVACSFFSKKTKKPDTAKTQKVQKYRKNGQKASVSAVVFTNGGPDSFGAGLKRADFFAENTIK